MREKKGKRKKKKKKGKKKGRELERVEGVILPEEDPFSKVF